MAAGSAVGALVGAGAAVMVGLGAVPATDGVELGSSEHPTSIMANSIAPTPIAAIANDLDITISLFAQDGHC